MTAFFIMVIAIGYLAAYIMGSPGILYGAVVVALIMNVGSYWFSDKLVIKMTGAQPATKASHPMLWNVVENLSITAGLPMPKVYVVNDKAPNAFATGRNPEHAAVAATSGLLDILSQTELEGVMAHELSHVGNRDMLVSTVAVVLAGFVAILADILIRSMAFGSDRDDSRVGAAFLVIGVIGIILAPVAAKMIQLAISRKREYLADASGALLTRYPEGLASALEKIHAYALPMARANTATAHLFIADPFGSDHKTFRQKLSNLFQTHPPAEDRVRILREMAK
ncbi:MAG: M48 family metalloprotease [Patescibacteria group bacterium]